MTRRRKQSGGSPPVYHLETLEQRILFSADATFTTMDVLPESDTVVVMLQGSQNDELVSVESVQTVKPKAKEMVIVDSALADLQKVMDGLSRAGLESTQVVVLDAQSDALTQISEILAQQSSLTAVHVISHGSSGVLELGEQRIETMDLLSRADELAQWRSAMEPGADFLLYGSVVSADGTGRQFIDTMARLTGADVSASTDLADSFLVQSSLEAQPYSASAGSGVLDDALLARQEILFLSPDVVDHQQLLHEIGSDSEVPILDPERDGLELNNQFRENLIYGNTGLGNEGVTANDAGGVDSGANNLQSRAEINSVASNGSSELVYDIDTTTLASGTYAIDFYASTDVDGGQVEGKRYQGTITGVADGQVSLTGTLAGSPITDSEHITLVTTDASGNSSEFSRYATPDTDGDGVFNGVDLADEISPATNSVQDSAAAIASESDVTQPTLELMFIDGSISNLDQMIADLQNESELDDTRTLEIVVLDAKRDGIAQITEALIQYDGIDDMHMVSHGSDGQVQLGSTTLSLDNLDRYRTAISAWQYSMSEEADILIYGCNVAESANGQELLNQLSELTATDVAASEDLTGHTDLGGDWDLEYTVGDVTTDVAFSDAVQTGWERTLATITVTTTNDENDGDTSSISALLATSGGTGISLREAIIAANNTAGDDTIVLAAGSYDLTRTGANESFAATGDLDIRSVITISGAGAGQTTISASGLGDRAFDVISTGNLTLNSLTIANTNASVNGGAVNNAGVLNAYDVVMRDNTGGSSGGAIYNSGTVTLERVSLYDNSTNTFGGAIYQNSGSLSLTNVVVSGNNSGTHGGGVSILGGTAVVNHSTIADNTASFNTGGFLVSTGSTTISNSIFADNTGGTGGGSYTHDISGSVTSGGRNILEDYSGFTAAGTDITGSYNVTVRTIDPTTGLAYYAIAPGDAAIDAAGGSSPSTDIRGTTRDANPDIGAYEYVSNFPPTAANNTVTTSEDTDYTFAIADFGFSDPDSGDTLASVQITTLESVGALQLSGVDVTLNQVISSADIVAGNLKYVPVANQNGSGYDSFGFSVNDGTVDSASSYTMTVDVTAINDAPTAANNTVTTSEDTDYTFTVADFGFSDLDSGDTLASVQITTLESVGALQLSGVDVTLNQVISSADIVAGNLKFVPIANQNGSGYDSFGFSVNDGTVDSASSYTMTVDVTAVNDAPTAANNTVTTSEDTDYTFTVADFGFSDPDSGDTLASVQITTLESVGALQLSGVDVTLNQVISSADIVAGNLKFVPIANQNGSGYDSFGFSVNDGTVDSASSYTMTVDVTAVNDAPTAANNTVTTSEDTDYTFTVADFGFSDPDSGDTLASVQITTLESVGALQLSGVDVTLNQVISSADIVAGNLKYVPVANQNGTGYDSFGFSVNDGTVDSASSYTMTVDVTAVNDAPTAANNTVTTSEDTDYTFTVADFGFSDLDSGDTLTSVQITTLESVGALQLSGVDVTLNQVISSADIVAGNLKFVPIANQNGSGYDGFGFSVNDGTVDSASSYTMTVDVTAVNDAPTAVNNTVTTSEDTDYTFTVADFGFSDPDSGDTLASVQITTLESVGALQLSGVDVTLNQVISSADIVAGNLKFVPVANQNGTGYDSFGFSVNDGTVDSASSYTMTVDVTVVNDAPTAVNNTVTTSEDTDYTFTVVDFGFSDPDSGDTLASVQITTLESVGALQLSGVDVTLNQVISSADIVAGNLKFVPVANQNGSSYDSFGFSVNDGTVDSVSSYTMTVDVTAVNDAPTAVNNTVTTSEDTGYTFTVVDFGFSDPDSGDTLASVQITTLESVGALQLSGVDVTLNQVISSADIVAGNLKFVPVANQNGSSYDSFGFSVNDGTVDSVSSYTMTVDVTAVNDAPVLSDTALSMSVSEDAGVPSGAVGSLLSDFTGGISDVDASSVQGIAITATDETNGSWYYTADAGTTWNTVGTVSNTAALLLADDANTRLYFAANADFNGNANGALTLRAWDQTSGGVGNKVTTASNGGTTAFSSTTDVIDVTVSAINDAPVNTVPGTQTIAEETTTGISGISISDVDDLGANLTTQLQVSAGVLNVTLSGSATISAGTNGSGDLTILGSKSDINATLATLTYTGNTNVNGVAADTLIVTTNDQGNTGSGGAQQDVDNVQIDITAINDAPVNTVPGTQTIAEETTTGISGISISDVDDLGANLTTQLQVSAGVLNVTLSGSATISAGTNGSGDLTILGSKSDINATLATLTYTGNTNVNGVAADTLIVTTNDQGNTGSGGAQQDVDNIQIDITAINDAPVLSDTALSMSVSEDAGVPSGAVGSLLSDFTGGISDVDAGSVQGIAITATDETNGSWYYTTDAGTTWNTVGAVSNTAALLLADDANTRLYFAADADFNGNANGALTLRAWDQTSGSAEDKVTSASNGGTSAFSSATDVIDVTVSAINDAPVNTVPGTQTIAEETTTGITGISISDVDDLGANLTTQLQVSAGVLNVTLSGSATISTGTNGSGDLTILGSKSDINASLATLTYTGNTNVNGVAADTLVVTTNDQGNTGSGGGQQDVDNIQIDITAINDAPVLSDTALSMSVSEDAGVPSGAVGSLLSDFTGGISDVDAGSVQGIAITATDETNGSWYYTTDAGTTWNTVGAVSNTAALLLADDANTRLYFAADADFNGNANGALTLRAWDQTSGSAEDKVTSASNGGTSAFSSATDVIDVTVSAINDAPVNTVPGTQTIAEETTTGISGISISDVDDLGANLTTQLQVSAGVLNVTLSGSATISAGTNGSGDLTILGSKSDINATLATLTYTGNTNVNGVAADTLIVTTNDQGNTGSGGAQQDVDNIQIDITAINDAPVNTVPGTQTIAEETTTGISGISISDVDDLGANLTTQLQVSAGVLNVTLSGSATISAGTNGSGDLTILGSKSDINATLATLTYTGNTNVNGVAADTLIVTTNDQGNTGSGGGQQDVDNIQIDITAVNDAPVNTVPGTQTIAEETTTGITGISISDVDDLGANLTTQLQVSAGVLNVTLSGSATISTGTNGSGDLTILGSKSDINATLATLTYTGNTNVSGVAADTLVVTTNDQGNTGSGGGQQDVDNIQIDITAINDPPVNTVPGTQTIAEETTTGITGISISDVDDLGANLTTQLQVSAGVLNVTLSGSATISAGTNGSGDLTILGSKSDINATLATLTYTGNTNVSGVAADTLVVTTNDQGNTGSGGAQQDVDNVQIDITAVNDAPVLSDTALSMSVSEDAGVPSGAVGSLLSDFTGGISDVDAGFVQGIAITATDETNGTWYYTTDAGTSWSTVGAVSNTAALLLADDANTRLYFAANADFNGNANGALTLRAWDQTSGSAEDKVTSVSNGGTTAFSSTTDVIDVTVSAINDAPVLSDTALSMSVAEDAGVPSGVVGSLLSDFTGGISDVDAGSVQGIAITATDETNGTWYYTTDAGTTWNTVGTVSNTAALLLADDANTRLYFAANADFNGNANGALTLRAWDQTSGSAEDKVTSVSNGGTTAFSSTTDVMDVTVTAINDAPVNTVPGTQTIAEETTTGITGISISDVDDLGANLTTQLQVSAGVLNVTLSGSATISTGTNGSGDLTILGSKSDINATLATLTYTGNTNVSGVAADTLIVTTNDQGNTGSGGAQQDVDNVQIDITAINDPPVNTVPGTQTIAEETTTGITGISISDVDDLGANLTTQLQVSAGVLNVTLSGSATISTGTNGSGDLTILGSKSDINASLATLTYTGNTNVNGVAADTLVVTTNDQGNTGSGGGQQDVDNIQIDITAINDAPVLSDTALSMSVSEDAGVPSGVVGSLLSDFTGGISDVDAGSVQGIAITATDETNGTWYYTTDAGATWSTVGAVSNTSALLLADDANTRLYFAANADFNGNANSALTLRAWDQTSGSAEDKVTSASNGGTTAFSSTTDVIDVTVSAVNDAPVLSDTTLSMSVSEDAGVPSGVVGSLLSDFTGGISDVDAGSVQGIAITATDETNGSWYYTTDAGTTWNTVGTVSNTAALLLADDANTRLYFAANADFNGNANGALTLRAWDQTSGSAEDKVTSVSNGGTTAFSSTTDVIDVTVTAINDAPVNTVPGTQTIAEETTTGITGISISDVDDLGANLTTQLQVSAGVLNVTLSGSATISAGTNGSGDLTILGSKSDINATLATLTYTGNTNVNGVAADTLIVTTNDQGNTGSGGAQQDVDNIQIDITAINDAPVNTVPGTQTIAEETTTGITGISISDVDDLGANLTTQLQVSAGVLNVTLSGSATISTGTNGSGDLTILGSKSDINASLATLTYTGNTNVNGVAADTLVVTTNDQGNTGSGGGQQDVDNIQIDITAINDAPVLSDTALSMSVSEDAGVPSGVVGSLLSDFTGGISDVDAGSVQGIAITATDETNGTWYYTTDAGATWSTVGAVSNTSALLLADDANTRLYFAANADFNGNANSALTLRAWDQTSGSAEDKVTSASNGGTTAFSSTTDVIDVTVSAVNDAPVLSDTTLSMSVSEDAGVPSGVVGSLLSDFTGGISDVDAGSVQGIAITATDETNGSWYYTTDAGTTWNTVGTVSNTAALLLADDANTRLYFAANADFNGNANGALTLRAWDQTSGSAEDKVTSVSNGGTTAFSSTTDVIDVTVTAINDAPVNTVPGTQTIAEETTTGITGISISDVDDLGANLTTQLQVSAGVLNVTLSGSATISAGTNGSGDLTILGSKSDINATLATLTYTGNTNVSGVAADTLVVTTNDQGNTGSGGGQQDVDNIQIDITAINDPPVNTVPGTQTIAEETTTGITGISISDVDDLGANLTTQLQVSAGVLNVTLSGSATISAGTNGSGDLTILGSKSDINATLATLTYTGNTNVSGVAADTLVVTTNDQGNTGSGGAQQDVDNVQIDITAVNDAPVLSDTALSMSVSEDAGVPSGAVGSLLSDFTGGISDVDAGFVQGIAITATDETNGTWYYTTDAGTSWSTVGAVSNTAALLLADDANTRLYFAANADFNGNANGALTLRAWDQTFGGVGNKVTTASNGGTSAFSSATDVIDVTVSAVNDAPVLSDTALSMSVSEDAGVPSGVVGSLLSDFTGGISDVDAGSVQGIAITATDETNGTWYYTTDAGTTWSTVGAVSNTSALLLADDANTRLYFAANADFNGNANGALTLRAWDQTFGGVGNKVTTASNGGTSAFSSATDVIDVTVSAINDVPTAANNTVTTDEDRDYTFTAADFVFSDIDGDSLASVHIKTLETVGNLKLSGVDVTLNQVISRANIDAGNLTFVPVANQNGSGYDSFGFSVNDGTVDSISSYTMTLNVTAVNDAPTAASNTVSTNEDTDYTFTVADFGFSDLDSGNTLTSVQITTLESVGALQLSGVDVTLNQVISSADIVAGYLKFVPVANQNGSGYDSFGFSVNDGSAESIVRYSMTVDVTAVNDAPIVTSASNTSASENQTTILTVTSTDVDGGTPTYSITGGADATLFTIDGSSGALTFNSAPDFEAPADAGADNLYELTVQVADGNGGATTQAIAVTVTNINEAPVINSGGAVVDNGGGNEPFSVFVNENQSWVVQVSATDADADATRTFSLTGGADQLAFSINVDTGDLKFVSMPDYEVKERFEVEVTVTDDGGLTAVQTVVINVLNVNESPMAQTDLLEASENQQLIIDPVSSMLSNDSDPEQDPLTLVSFSQPQYGALTLNAQGLLIYEPDDNFIGMDSFDYVVQDSGGLQVNARVWLDVRALNDPILAAALPTDSGMSEIDGLNLEHPYMAQPVVTTDTPSAYSSETNVSEPALFVEPATAQGTPPHTVVTENLFSGSATVTTNEQLSGLGLQALPNRPDEPIISSLLQLLYDHEIADLDTSFRLIVFGQPSSIEFRDAISALRDQIDQMLDQSSRPNALTTVASWVIGASLTTGIVTWVLHSGLLISATINASPLWRPVDPVFILTQADDDEPWYEKGATDRSSHRKTAANDPDKNDPDNQAVEHG